MRIRAVLAIAAVLGLLWWGTVGYKGSINGVHDSSTVIDVPGLVAGTPSSAQPPPVDVAPVVPEPQNTTRLQDVQDSVMGIGAHVGDAIAWFISHLPLLLGALVLLVVVAVARRIRALRPVTTDPQRAYAPEQRAESFARAGGQCEYTSWGISRCTAQAEHADHLFPWSKGGATSLANCVASCAHHNTSKGAKILPRWKVRWLESRRRRYFPAGVPVKVGQRYDPRDVPDVVAARALKAPPADGGWQEPPAAAPVDRSAGTPVVPGPPAVGDGGWLASPRTMDDRLEDPTW